MAVVYSKVLLFDPPLIYTAPDTCVFGAVETGNPGSKLHWRLWEKGGFTALAGEWYFLADNKAHGGHIWAK